MMASSSSITRIWTYDVFPSFRGEDVRRCFLSHLVKELDRHTIKTFDDNGIKRSHKIAPALLLAIEESKISIIIFSKNYASSSWCLNELVHIHKCYEEFGQTVIPVFYEVDPSHVRYQTGEFGKAFEETCQGKTEDDKQRCRRVLADVASIAGEHSKNWIDDARMIEKICKDVSIKLFGPYHDFGDFVGVEAHVETLMSMLYLESAKVKMLGIVGTSGIGKSTIARALCRQIKHKFQHYAFISCKKTNHARKKANLGMKLSWIEQFLSKILGPNEIKIDSLGVVEQSLKQTKVLIVLDDVDEIELLETLVGQREWFGLGSRIIVVTQDRALQERHEFDLIYKVEFPSKELALQMFCRSAFRRNSPPGGCKELADEVTNLAGNLPIGLNALGSFLREKGEELVEILPRLRNGLNRKVEKTLRFVYDGLDSKDQELFLYIACLFNGASVDYIKFFFQGSVNIRLGILAEISFIRIIKSPCETVEVHYLLQQLGREIVSTQSITNPQKRRLVVDLFKDNTGTQYYGASSSSTSRSWSYDVFPSFRGEDVRKSFLSYLLKELHRKSVHIFIDNGIERHRAIAPELLLAIEESRISIVVFSRNYASSTWCLNELVHIHKCCTENSQMVIPIFYDVDPSHVRKQSGEFGKAFEETCKGKAEDDKERWIRALVEVANMAGYDSQNWDNEADMIEKITTDVSNKLNNITLSDEFAEFVRIGAHLEALHSMLCLESGGVRMVGIVGTPRIGMSTIARALFDKLKSQFYHHVFFSYKRTKKKANLGVKLSWIEQFLSKILCQNDIKIDSLGVVEQRLKHKKVLIVLDDVDEIELLETLVGQPEWFGFESRIIVVTQDRALLKSHNINLIYDVELPSEDLALQKFC